MAHINSPSGTATHAGSLAHPAAAATHTITDDDEEYVAKAPTDGARNGAAGPVGESSQGSDGLRAIPLDSPSDGPSAPSSPARVTSPRSRGHNAGARRTVEHVDGAGVRMRWILAHVLVDVHKNMPAYFAACHACSVSLSRVSVSRHGNSLLSLSLCACPREGRHTCK